MHGSDSQLPRERIPELQEVERSTGSSSSLYANVDRDLASASSQWNQKSGELTRALVQGGILPSIAGFAIPQNESRHGSEKTPPGESVKDRGGTVAATSEHSLSTTSPESSRTGAAAGTLQKNANDAAPVAPDGKPGAKQEIGTGDKPAPNSQSVPGDKPGTKQEITSGGKPVPNSQAVPGDKPGTKQEITSGSKSLPNSQAVPGDKPGTKQEIIFGGKLVPNSQGLPGDKPGAKQEVPTGGKLAPGQRPVAGGKLLPSVENVTGDKPGPAPRGVFVPKPASQEKIVPGNEPVQKPQGVPGDKSGHKAVDKPPTAKPEQERVLPPSIEAVIGKNVGRFDTVLIDLNKKAAAIERKFNELSTLISNPNLPIKQGGLLEAIGSLFQSPLKHEGAIVPLREGDRVLAEGKEQPEQLTKPEKIAKERAKDDPALPERSRKEMNAERDRLLKHLESSGLPEQEIGFVKSDMERLESRSKQDFDDRVPERELTKFYKDINRLLAAPDGKVPLVERQVLAQQLIRQAGNPENINQGAHMTCNVTTIENVLYSRCPSEVSRVVREAALTGKFQCADGSDISLSKANLTPGREEVNEPPTDGRRSFASQIFQETAINAHWQRQTITPAGDKVQKGSIRYEVGPTDFKDFDFGERLLGPGGKPLHSGKGDIVKGPYLDLPQMQDIYQQIAGKTPFALFIERNSNYDKTKGVLTPRSVAELKELLGELKEGSKYGRFPVVVALPGHVNVIRDYDPKKGLVAVDDSAGRSHDHLGKPGTKAMKTVQQVFDEIHH